MDKNMYQTELDKVRFTREGRKSLADTLMTAAPPRRSVGWPRKGLAMGLAAVLLVGSALAAAGPLWERYFDHLDETQQEVIDTLSQELPAAVSNGTTMTPLAAFGDEDFYYLMLEITPPEGTVLPVYGEDEGYYQLFGDSADKSMTLTDSAGNDIRGNWEFKWMPRAGEDSPLTAVIRLWPREGVDFSDGMDKILHIPGLWVQSPDKEYTPVLTGSWDFNIGAHTGGIESRVPDVSGVIADDEEFGPLTLDSIRISPLGIRWRYHWEAPVEGICPGAPLSLVMEDGSEVRLSNSVGSWNEEECWHEAYGPFEAPVDLDAAAYIRWGTTVIPLS